MSQNRKPIENNETNQLLNLKRVKPYGDTMNDGKVQVSFTLPLKNDEVSKEAAILLAKKMGLDEPQVTYSNALDDEFTFFVIYGGLLHNIDCTSIKVNTIENYTMDMHEVDEYIEKNIKRKVVIIGASTGTDAHTVGIDAIINMKGYAGHYGLERYQMFEAYNLGSQVSNEEFVRKAIECNADVLMVSQTVTQKNIHIQNLTELVEILEAEGIRDKVILICGGARINHRLAKELGYDAGFGTGKFADDVASFAVNQIVNRGLI